MIEHLTGSPRGSHILSAWSVEAPQVNPGVRPQGTRLRPMAHPDLSDPAERQALVERATRQGRGSLLWFLALLILLWLVACPLLLSPALR